MTRSASAIARSLMPWFRVWRRRLHELVTKQRHEQDLKAEIEANLGLQIEDNIRAGMSLEEARRVALLKFGSVEEVKERVRDRRGIPFVETLIQDIRLAVRLLNQNRGWSAVAVLSLGIGIGANSAAFSAVNEFARVTALWMVSLRSVR